MYIIFSVLGNFTFLFNLWHFSMYFCTISSDSLDFNCLNFNFKKLKKNWGTLKFLTGNVCRQFTYTFALYASTEHFVQSNYSGQKTTSHL